MRRGGRKRRGRRSALSVIVGRRRRAWVRTPDKRWPPRAGLGRLRRTDPACFSKRTADVKSKAARGNCGAERRVAIVSPSSRETDVVGTVLPKSARQSNPARPQRATDGFRSVRQSIRGHLNPGLNPYDVGRGKSSGEVASAGNQSSLGAFAGGGKRSAQIGERT